MGKWKFTRTTSWMLNSSIYSKLYWVVAAWMTQASSHLFQQRPNQPTDSYISICKVSTYVFCKFAMTETEPARHPVSLTNVWTRRRRINYESQFFIIFISFFFFQVKIALGIVSVPEYHRFCREWVYGFFIFFYIIYVNRPFFSFNFRWKRIHVVDSWIMMTIKFDVSKREEEKKNSFIVCLLWGISSLYLFSLIYIFFKFYFYDDKYGAFVYS